MNDTSIVHYSLWTTNTTKSLDAHNKTIRAWKYVFNNISDKFDWYYKVGSKIYLYEWRGNNEVLLSILGYFSKNLNKLIFKYHSLYTFR